jgi:hypothetical protein
LASSYSRWQHCCIDCKSFQSILAMEIAKVCQDQL